jgi:hypothetical protein
MRQLESIRKEVRKMVTGSNNKLEQLRQAVLCNQRGREVEVEPTGEIRIPDEAECRDQDLIQHRPLKPSKMSDYAFGG